MIGNYGEGELPRIAVNGKMKDALYLCNQQYWEISGLDISNTVEGFTMVSNDGIPTGNVTERQDDPGKLLGRISWNPYCRAGCTLVEKVFVFMI